MLVGCVSCLTVMGCYNVKVKVQLKTNFNQEF